MPLSALFSVVLAAAAHAGDRNAELAWTSSVESLGAPYASVDLPAVGGTDLGLGTGDSATVSLSWGFPFGGSTYSGVIVHSYGVIELSGTPGPRGTSGTCVDDGVSGRFLAPWWRDWDLDAAGTVTVKDFGSSLAVQWSDLEIDGVANTMQFTAWLHESGEVVFSLDDVWNGEASLSRGADSAIGYQDGTTSVSILCDTETLNGAESFWFTPMGLRHFADDVAAADHADTVLLGEAAGDEAGYALADAGDVDGDGVSDLLVGAPGGSLAYLITATDSGTQRLADATAVITGTSGTRFADALAGGQDFDGDGVPDALIGAYRDDTSDNNAGAAFLFLGTSLAGPVDAADADATWTGENSSDYAGYGVALIGDVDGDGYGDALIGAPNHDSAGSNAGAAYVVRGGPTPADGDLGSADATLLGVAASDYAGFVVAAPGDVDSDGLADLVVGAYGSDGGGADAGAAVLIAGADLGPGSQSLADFDVLYGALAGDNAGLGLAGADLDDDGLPDLLVGSPTTDSQAGAVALVLSGGTWPTSLADADAALTGTGGERLGFALAALDLGDQTLAVAAGAYSNNDAAGSAGKLYVVPADGADGPVADTSRGSLSGPAASAYLGRSVQSLDRDGDGWTDLATGAWGADGDEAGAGAVYVVPGRPTWRDSDGDGFLSDESGGNDCDDGDATRSPGLPDDCNGRDDDCNGTVDDGWADTDGDGTADCIDTEDCDLADNDGDGTVDEDTPDTDGDGTCDALDSEDCDGLDNDGDGATDEDFPDTDGDGTADCLDVEECDGLDNDGDLSTDEGYADTDGDGRADCVDNESCDGLDNDGDGAVDEGHADTDGDGIVDCLDFEDCDGRDNDGDGVVDEAAPDIDGDGICDQVDTESCDGLDNDGDGAVDEDYSDSDGDGLADCLDGEDCDGADNDGDGAVDEGYADGDGDGTADCVDTEECDGLDNDGDDWTDEGWGDSDHDGLVDCLDGEECDGLDNDGDGVADEGYPDTDGDLAADCIDVEECDGVDNDGDLGIDEGFWDADGDGTPNCLDDTPFPIAYESVTDGDTGRCSTAGGADPGALGWLFLVGLGLVRRQRDAGVSQG